MAIAVPEGPEMEALRREVSELRVALSVRMEAVEAGQDVIAYWLGLLNREHMQPGARRVDGAAPRESRPPSRSVTT